MEFTYLTQNVRAEFDGVIIWVLLSGLNYVEWLGFHTKENRVAM